MLAVCGGGGFDVAPLFGSSNFSNAINGASAHTDKI